jgi:hypothetical protein
MSNVFLHEADAKLVGLGLQHLRMCDRFLLFSPTQMRAAETLTLLRAVLESQLLVLNESKTKTWLRPEVTSLIAKSL